MPDEPVPVEPEADAEPAPFHGLTKSIEDLVAGYGLKTFGDLAAGQLGAKVTSSDLLARAKHQAELPLLDVPRWTDPTDVRLDAVKAQLAQLIELERRAAQRAELDAQLGTKQDEYTRRVANAGLIVAIAAGVFGVIGVIADIVIAILTA